MSDALCMIIAEVSSWSVVFYSNGEADGRAILRSIYDAALARHIGVGSVGVFDMPLDSETQVHVDLLHCNKEEAVAILVAANIPLKRIEFVEVKIEWDDNASRRNRKRRITV